MARNSAPEEDGTGAPRRRLVLIGIAVLCLVAATAALFAVLRSDGGAAESDGEEITEITFNEQDAATSLLAPPPGSRGIMELNNGSGPAGSTVRVQGVNFKAGKDFGPVEVYWNVIEGKPLATAEGPRFAVDITVPSDAPVLTEGHNVIVVQKSKSGEVVNQDSRRFYVVPKS